MKSNEISPRHYSIKKLLKEQFLLKSVEDNGGGGIRTHGALADTLVFKTRALNHSTTPPGEIFSFNF